MAPVISVPLLVTTMQLSGRAVSAFTRARLVVVCTQNLPSDQTNECGIPTGQPLEFVQQTTHSLVSANSRSLFWAESL
jgi:hypothetical protein